MPESVVEWKPRPRNRVFIRLSGGRFFVVPESDTIPLKTGSVLTDAEIEQLARVDQYFRGRDKALRMLSRRARTCREIRTTLDGIGVMPSIRDGIVEELTEQGLLDDARFAREYVRNRVELKHLGPHRLRFDMKKLGLAAALVDKTVASALGEERQEELARDIVDKRLGGRRPDEGDIRRLAALLRRKGMDYEVINRITVELLQQSGREETE